MCDKCKRHTRYWIHISDQWNKKEKIEMLNYLLGSLDIISEVTSIHKEMQRRDVHNLKKEIYLVIGER